MKKLILLSIFSVFTLMGFAQTNLTVAETEKLIQNQKKLVIVDVRTPEEFQAGHLPYAVLIDFRNPNFKSEIAKLSKNRPTLVYCRTGHRSGEAVKIMHEMGFKKVYNLVGGYVGWKR